MDKREHTFWKFPSVKDFISQNKYVWWITGIFLFIAYGIKIFNISISHDTEYMISAPELLYPSWFGLGRSGLILLKSILGTYILNPYTAACLMVIAMMANSMLWNYLFCWLGGGERVRQRCLWVFPTVFFTSVIMAEQNGFLLQSYEINVALLIVGAGLLILCRVILEKKKWYWYIPAVLCCTLAFSCYQSFVPLFAAGAAICFLLVYDRYIQNRMTVTTRFCLSFIGKLMAVFFVSCVFYFLIDRIGVYISGRGQVSYFSDWNMWGKLPVSQCVENIVGHILAMLLGRRIFYTKVFGFVYFCIACYALARIRKKEPCYILYLLSVGFCLYSPFIMTTVMGNGTTARTELPLPFIVGFFVYYLLNKLPIYRAKQWKYTYIAASAAMVVFVMHQSLWSARLYYTQYVVYQQDVQLAVKISRRIEELGLGEFPQEPVVFIGTRAADRNASCYRPDQLELIGWSFFEVSFSTEHGSKVMDHFMDTIGYPYIVPGGKQAALADREAVSMPCWPAEGSVAEKNGLIIVKLKDEEAMK